MKQNFKRSTQLLIGKSLRSKFKLFYAFLIHIYLLIHAIFVLSFYWFPSSSVVATFLTFHWSNIEVISFLAFNTLCSRDALIALIYWTPLAFISIEIKLVLNFTITANSFFISECISWLAFQTWICALAS